MRSSPGSTATPQAVRRTNVFEARCVAIFRRADDPDIEHVMGRAPRREQRAGQNRAFIRRRLEPVEPTLSRASFVPSCTEPTRSAAGITQRFYGGDERNLREISLRLDI